MILAAAVYFAFTLVKSVLVELDGTNQPLKKDKKTKVL